MRRVILSFVLIVAGCSGDAIPADDGAVAAPRDLAMVFPAPEDLATPDPCHDKQLSPGESDVDCGGSCDSCDVGKRCMEDKECTSGLCVGGMCSMPSCMDLRLDGDESDVDCGGSCAPCPDGATCKANSDCTPRVCRQMRCQSVNPRVLAFAPPVGYPAVGGPRALSAGDIDGDKNLDLVTNLASMSSVGVFKGRPDGTFEALASYPAGNVGWAIVAADLDADGRADVATANSSSSGVVVLLSRNGALAKPDSYPVSTKMDADSIDVGDFDGDARPDLVVGTQGAGGVWPNMGGGKFGAERPLPNLGGISLGIAAGDVNGDGKADFVLSNTTSVFLFLGPGKDPLASQWMHGGIAGRPAVTLVRIDGDKLLDFAIADGSGTVTAYLNDGKGGFRNQPGWPAASANTGFGIVHADFNADGWDDVAIAGDGQGGNIAVVLNDGGNGWKPAVPVKVGMQPYGITTGDFDHDGLPDIAVVIQNRDPETLQVLLNRSR